MSAWPVTGRPEPRYCSFCGRSEHEVEVLLAGPNEVFICDGCVEGCNELATAKKRQKADRRALPPSEKGDGHG